MTDITPPAQPEHAEDGSNVVQPAAVDLPDVQQGGPYVPAGDGNYQPDGEAYAPGGAEYEAAHAAAAENASAGDEGADDERQYNA